MATKSKPEPGPCKSVVLQPASRVTTLQQRPSSGLDVFPAGRPRQVLEERPGHRRSDVLARNHDLCSNERPHDHHTEYLLVCRSQRRACHVKKPASVITTTAPKGLSAWAHAGLAAAISVSLLSSFPDLGPAVGELLSPSRSHPSSPPKKAPGRCYYAYHSTSFCPQLTPFCFHTSMGLAASPPTLRSTRHPPALPLSNRASYR
jgi:hypothetical protein